MKISEFIYGFNECSRNAQYDEQGNVYIYDNTYDTMMAQLGIDSSVWEIEDDSFVMSPSLLRLMAELADTPPEERKVIRKYVILNGLPHHGTCRAFFIDAQRGMLIPIHLDVMDDISLGIYSKEELREAKKALTLELAAAVDMMTVTLERAIELAEKSRHDDLD